MIDVFFISKSAELLSGDFGNIAFFGQTILAVDLMSLFTLVFIQLMAVIVLLYSLKGVQADAQKSFFVLFPLTVAACNGVILSVHAISFVVFWGLSGMTLFLFALLGRTKNSPATATKTIMLMGGTDALLVMGLAIMWVMNGQSSWAFGSLTIQVNDGLSWLAFFLVLTAAFAKAGGFPLHTWLPDFSRDSQVESAALLPASLDKLLGIYLLARMMTSLFTVSFIINLILMSLGAITVITAVMMAMNQHNGRRLLGYHAVSQVGYMILGIGSGNPIAFAGGLFHMVNNTIYKSNLFLTLGSVEKQTGTNELDDLGGLARNMPITFLMALIGALSISGIPPFNGFFSKWMIYQGVLETAKGTGAGYQLWILVCLILAVFGSALTLASFMKFLHAIYLGKRQEKHKDIKEAPANQWLATGILAIFCIVFGVAATVVPLKLFIYPAMQTMGLELPIFTGLYQPVLLLSLFLIAFVLGMFIYVLTKNVRFDDIYLGGMAPLERFRVVGTAFYNEIRNMRGLKGIYDAADKHAFDAYDVGEKSSLALSRVFQKAHPGLLQLYILFIVVGVAIFLLVL
jgi:multicomponent Na+:H+ antiporter subunit A